MDFSIRSRWRSLVCVTAITLDVAVLAATRAPFHSDPWEAAVRARAEFEAEPKGSHTRVEYARVIEDFRTIYHHDPACRHAARAVEQVAELLEEQGVELHDNKAVKEAVSQLDFLRRAYPGYRGEPLPMQSVQGPPSHRQEPVGGNPAVGSIIKKKLEVSEISTDLLASSQGRDIGHPHSEPDVATVTGIRHWSTATYTRLAIDLSDDDADALTYEAARVENPDRIFFDLHHAKLAPHLAGRSFTVTDGGFLTRIRAAQAGGNVTRVVLDVPPVAEYSAFLLPNPERLIIDIHGRQTGIAAPHSTHRPQGTAGEPLTASNRRTEISSLPPMPVSDGIAEFSSPKPTAARSVPNTVSTASSANGSEVAAVSEQPGKVVATRRPTSQPISDRFQGSGSRIQSATTEHSIPRTKRGVVASGPQTSGPNVPDRRDTVATATAPPPTAEGDTTLMRALGLKIGRIVIDAGHGGHDSGTLGVGGIQEKDVVLDVALRLGKLLHERLGAEIVYTRSDDTFIPLETRTAIANKAQADLFISVHANSSPDEGARGVEVYYLNFTSDPEAMNVASRENAVSTQSVHELSDLVKKIALKDKIDESRELASDVDTSLYAGLTKGNAGLRDRGVKKAPFVVLIGANMPSILAEISFVTNSDDAAQLATEAYRERVAESLYKGVAKYAAGINGTPKKGVVEQAAR